MKRVNMTEFVTQLKNNQPALIEEWVTLTLEGHRRKRFQELKSSPSELTAPELFHIHRDLSHLLDAVLFNLENVSHSESQRRNYEAPMLIKIKALENTPTGNSHGEVLKAVKAAIAYPYQLWEVITRFAKKEPLPGALKFEIEEMARAGIAGYDKEQRLIAYIKKREIESGVFSGEAPNAACSGGSCSGDSCSTENTDENTQTAIILK